MNSDILLYTYIKKYVVWLCIDVEGVYMVRNCLCNLNSEAKVGCFGRLSCFMITFGLTFI